MSSDQRYLDNQHSHTRRVLRIDIESRDSRLKLVPFTPRSHQIVQPADYFDKQMVKYR